MSDTEKNVLFPQGLCAKCQEKHASLAGEKFIIYCPENRCGMISLGTMVYQIFYPCTEALFSKIEAGFVPMIEAALKASPVIADEEPVPAKEDPKFFN